MIYLEDENGFFENHADIYEQVEQVIQKTLELEHVPYPVEISLTVVDKEEIQEINRMHREIDRPTDVLSFPQIETDETSRIDWANLQTAAYMNLDTKDIMLGDIVLCEAIAREQAESYQHSLTREVCFLVAHSMLHLLGYDHMEPEEEKVMIEKQKNILECLGICR